MNSLQRRLLLTAALIGCLLATVAAQSSVAETVYVTRTGAKYHRVSCRHLARSSIPMALAEAAKVYGPCSVCRPPFPVAASVREGAAAERPVPAAASSSSTQTPVVITRTGAKYHVAGCRTLRNGGIASTLGEASRRFGPCAVCRPPVLVSAAEGTATLSPQAPAVRATRCQATTRAGRQCSRNAKAGSSYCWQHGG